MLLFDPHSPGGIPALEGSPGNPEFIHNGSGSKSIIFIYAHFVLLSHDKVLSRIL